MTTRSIIFAAAVAALAISGQSASASDQVKVGVLSCQVSGGPGLIVASNRALDCVFTPETGMPEHYTGSITKVGADVGVIQTSRLAWAVFAPTSGAPMGGLAGSYGGVTGEVTVGVGLGGNVLIGGSANTIALQPVSVGAQTGLNVAGGIAGLSLTFVPPPKPH